MLHPAIDTNIGVIHSLDILFIKSKFCNNIATKLVVSFIAIKLQTHAAKVITHATKRATHCAIVIELGATRLTMVVP
jgi:hypothetical protein